MTEEQFACYDSADYLKTEEDIAAYLEAVMEEGGDDPAYIARARNMTALAQEVGMSRVGLNKALSGEGNLRLEGFSSRAARTRKHNTKAARLMGWLCRKLTCPATCPKGQP